MYKKISLTLVILALGGCRIVSQQELADLKSPPNPHMADIDRTWQDQLVPQVVAKARPVAELMTALQPAFARISEQGIRYSALPGHTAELAEALNQELSAKWSRLRGIEIVSLGVSGVKASEEDEQMIKELQRSAAFMDPTRAAAHLVGAQASAMQAAASNTAAGPAMAFMGMNQAAAAGGVNARDLYQMGGQQTAAQPQAAPAAGWTCSCGHTGNTGKFCAECGKPRPEAPAVWVCSCGAKNSGKFCSECGSPRPAAKCANCGFVPADPANPPKFCPECGKPFGA